jgi:type IV pilus assembly protein PilM
MEFFGLDIGTHNIKLAQVKKNKDKYQLIAFGSGPSTTKGLFSEAQRDLLALVEIIKKLYKDAGIKTKNVATALPQDQVFTRVVTLPSLSEEEIESALQWEAEQYVPLPLSEVILTHEIVNKTKEDSKENIEVLLAAAPKSLVEKTMNILKMAGLVPVSIEMEIMSMARSLVSPDSQQVLLVDFGAKATDLAIVENGRIVFVYSVPTAGEALTRAISLELGLESSQSEAYKRSYGVDPEKLEGKIRAALKPLLATIVSEIKKAIQFYQEKGKNVQNIVLSGGGAALPEINTFLAKELNLEVQIGNPFSQIIEDDLSSKLPSYERALYSVAVGLAMKEI